MPYIKVPEFIMIRNAYNSSIKPFSVQIKNIVSLWFASDAPKRIIMNTPLSPKKTTDDQAKRSVSPKSPRRSGIRKIRA